MLFVTGGTFAYLAASASNSSITGNMGKVDLTLTVTKVLPDTDSIDNIILINTDELPTSLNKNCMDNEEEYTLCQLYKINLANIARGVNTRVKGGKSFNNANTPNLSWMLIENYDSNNSYNSTTLGSDFHTSSSEFTNFVGSYLLAPGTNNITYYI